MAGTALDSGSAVLPTPAPFPTFNGTAEAIKALTAANVFRDISGMAQVASMLETAVGASSSGATAAGEQASKNFETYTKYLQAMVEQLAPLVEGALTDGASSGLTGTMKGGLAAKKAKTKAGGAGKASGTLTGKSSPPPVPAEKTVVSKASVKKTSVNTTTKKKTVGKGSGGG